MALGLGGSSGASSLPPPPSVSPVNIGSTLQTGIAADQFGYNFSDANFAARFPGLVATRTADLNTAYKELTGPLDPVIQNQFTSTGLENSLSSFGGGQATPDVTSKGGIGRNTIGADIGKETQGYQDSARSYVETLMSENQQRAFGLSGGDLLNLAVLNQGNLAQANQQAAGYASAVGAASAQANAARTNTEIGAGASVIAAVLPSVIAA